jgi:uncharacterized membrane protein
LSGKSGQIVKDNNKANIFALASGLSVGVANFFSAKLSELGPKAFWAMWLGVLLPVLFYYGFSYIKSKCTGKPFFEKKNSMYFRREGLSFRFAWDRFIASMALGTIQIVIQMGVICSFYFANLSGVNPGIIASIFASNTLFISAWFYF